jgi:hypothetical protein
MVDIFLCLSDINEIAAIGFFRFLLKTLFFYVERLVVR